jgi:predicted dinucleotide-binding enzyme
MIISVVGGSGGVGTALAARLAAAGHSIVLASRDPAAEKVQAAKKKIASAAKLPESVSALSIREACDKSDAVVSLESGVFSFGCPDEQEGVEL